MNKSTRLWLVDYYHNHITIVSFYSQQQRVYSFFPCGTVHHICVLSPEMYCRTDLPLKIAVNVTLLLWCCFFYDLFFQGWFTNIVSILLFFFFLTLTKYNSSQNFLQMKIWKNDSLWKLVLMTYDTSMIYVYYCNSDTIKWFMTCCLRPHLFWS